MKPEVTKRYAILLVIVIAAALLLSLAWHVPYVYTLIGFSVWAFVGHLVTADDDAPGGWSNPDGPLSFPRAELLIKALVLGALCALAVLSPAVRSLGGIS
ncbi:hypothetical protein ACPPVV_17715 [Rhodanobacter sp. Col0626]|uniref:hypothetical protein n=1 Tax=Rhodanobacter sp. Col0626 TaxID=3415679 RepID=UPI003CF3741F